MEMDPNPPSFNLQYQPPPTTVANIGEGYAKGITAAGTALSDATKGVMDVMARNQTANDTLQAMYQNKMLSPDAYKSVAGKGLGAKEQLVGLYAGQWIAQQAAQRQQALEQGKGAVEIGVEHAKLLDTINAVRSGYGAAAGVQPGKLQVTPQTAPGATAQSAPVLAPLAAGRNVPVLQTNWSGTPGAPTPLGTDVSNPQIVNSPQLQAAQAQRAAQTQVQSGPAISGKAAIPPGARIGAIGGQRGILMQEGPNMVFHPFQ